MSCCIGRSDGLAANSQTLQETYDLSVPATIVVNAVNGTVTVQDNAVPIGSVFSVLDNSGFAFADFDPSDINLGYHNSIVSGGPFSTLELVDGMDSMRWWPGDRTFTSSQGNLMRLSGTHVLDYVNASFGGLNLQATLEHSQAGNALNHALLFNHGNTYRNTSDENNNYGPIQGFIDQPNIQVNRSTPGAITMPLFRSFLSQPSFNRTAADGSLTVTSAANAQFFGTVETGIAITTWTRIELGPFQAPATGAITTLRGIDIADEAQPTNTTSIRIQQNDLGGGTFRSIEAIGTAISTFAADVHANDGVAFVLGSVASSRVAVLRSSAGVARTIAIGGANNEGVDLDLDATADVAEWSSSTGAGFKWSPTGAANAVASLVMGDALDPAGVANWWMAWAPGARTVDGVGSWSDILFSPGADVDLDGNAMTTVSAVEFSEPGIALAGGSVVNAFTVVIVDAPTEGTGLNGALWVQSGSARFDGRVDINNPIALGAGAAATLGTIGGTGPTAAAQRDWVEIDVNGSARWIATWS